MSYHRQNLAAAGGGADRALPRAPSRRPAIAPDLCTVVIDGELVWLPRIASLVGRWSTSLPPFTHHAPHTVGLAADHYVTLQGPDLPTKVARPEAVRLLASICCSR